MKPLRPLSLLLCVVTAFGINNFSFAADSMAVTLSNIEGQIDDPNKAASDQIFALSNIIKAQPNNGRAHFLMARAMEKGGYVSLAQDHFKEALKLDRPDTLMWQYRNRLLQQATDAEQYLVDMEQSEPHSAQTAVMLALTEIYKDGSIADAQKYLQEARKIDPNQFGIATLEGWIKLKQGQPKQAISLLQPDRDKNAYDPLVNTIVGEALMQSGEAKQAQPYLERGYQCFGDMKGIGGALAQSYFLQGKREDAIYPAARNLGAATVKPELLKAKQLAKTVFASVDDKTLKRQLSYAGALVFNSPLGARMHLAMGDVFDQLNKKDFAVEHYLLGLNGMPTHGRGWYRLAQDVQNYYGADRHALYFYDKALQCDPGNKIYQAARDRLARAMRGQNAANDLALNLRQAFHKSTKPPLHPWLAKMTFDGNGELIMKRKKSATASATNGSNPAQVIDLTKTTN